MTKFEMGRKRRMRAVRRRGVYEQIAKRWRGQQQNGRVTNPGHHQAERALGENMIE